MTSIMHEVMKALQSQQNDNPLIEQVSSDDVYSASLMPLDNLEINERPKELILTANNEVLIQSYKFETGSEGHYRIREALEKLRLQAETDKRSVTVNILVNTRGKVPELLLKPNEQVDLRAELPSDNEYFHVNIAYHQAEAFGSYHSKMIVVDGRSAIVRGGEPSRVNTSSRQNTSTKEPLVETGARFSGPIVTEIRRDFVRAWNKNCTPNQKMDDDVTHTFNSTNNSENRIKIGYISKKANGNPLMYRDKHGPFKIAYLKALSKAKNNVKIVTPNLNDPDIIQAIAAACNRGVKVHLLMSKTFNDPREAKLGGTNTDGVRRMADQINRTMLQNLDIRWSTNQSGEVTKLQEPGGVHGKYACFDDKFVITGSSPLDLQGTMYSKEADVFFENADKAREFNQQLFDSKYNSGKNYVVDAYENICALLLANIKDDNNELYTDIDELIAEEVDPKTILYLQKTSDEGLNARALVDSLDSKIKSSASESQYLAYKNSVEKELGLLKAKSNQFSFGYDKLSLYEKYSINLAVVLIYVAAALARVKELSSTSIYKVTMDLAMEYKSSYSLKKIEESTTFIDEDNQTLINP